MRARPFSFGFCAILGALAALAPAQTPAVASGEPQPPRVMILGASVSAGFEDGVLTRGGENRTVTLHKVLRGWLEDIDGDVRSLADASMFMAAEQRGEAAVTRATKARPDLVVAVDFLFWFGYGVVDAPADDDEAARLQRLRFGLGLLDRIAAPMVVGDLPDVHGASTRMIRAAQMPTVAVLDRLDAEIASWAKARPRVRLFPLRALVAEMKDKGIVLPLAGGALRTAPGALMQGDRLHATRVGMALLGHRLQDHCRLVLPTALADRLPKWSFEQFVAAAEAASDLDELRAPAPAGTAR